MPEPTTRLTTHRTTQAITRLATRAAHTLGLAASLTLCGTAPAWALLPIEHWTQPSGAQIWLVHSPHIPMVDVNIAFDAGSRRDPAGQSGLADAVALMALKGVTALPGPNKPGPSTPRPVPHPQPALDENAIQQAWADLGATFSAHASRDSLDYTLRSLTTPGLLHQAADLAARHIATPSWPAPVWQRERERWAATIAEANTRAATVAQRTFTQATYGPHPYGHITTAHTLERITPQDMRTFHARSVQACRAKVSIVGAITRPQADQLVQRLLSQLPPHLPPPSAATPQTGTCPPLPEVASVPALEQAQQLHIPFQSAQAHVIIGQPGIARSHPEYLALTVGNHILGGGGFSSRLMQQVREKRGLTYGVSSSFSPGLHAGAFTISLQTRPDQAELATRISREVLEQFVHNGPTEEELQNAKDNLTGGFALRIDSNRKLLSNVANIAWHGLPLDYLNHWSAQVQALTVADIRAAMQRTLQPDRMVTVILGASTSSTAPAP